MKTSEIIRDIESRIWDPSKPETEKLTPYPCFRIDESVTELRADRKQYRTVKTVFLDHIDGFKTFEGWGVANGIFSPDDTPANRRFIQQKRIEWIKSMIAELEAKGM